jgi:tRNA pseudouridine55 synthase
MNGIIVIDKPQGMTSHDVVSFLRRKTGIKRIGHTGTLDPMATGVLPVFIGNATRLIEYAGRPKDPEAKLYRCRMKLGIETDTQDIWGKTLEKPDGQGGKEALLPGAEEIERVLKGFEGPGKQAPPMYSAVKVDGRKLYEYARSGISVDESKIKVRDIYITHIMVTDIDADAGAVCFDVHCSRGVYIRTICADAGKLLGCGAVMSGLTRLKSDGFSIEDATPLDLLRGDEAAMPPLLPADAPLSWMGRVDLDEEGAAAFAQGQEVLSAGYEQGIQPLPLPFAPEPVRVYGPGSFLGIGTKRQNARVKPEKVLV